MPKIELAVLKDETRKTVGKIEKGAVRKRGATPIDGLATELRAKGVSATVSAEDFLWVSGDNMSGQVEHVATDFVFTADDGTEIKGWAGKDSEMADKIAQVLNKMKADKPSAKTTAKAEETAKMKKGRLILPKDTDGFFTIRQALLDAGWEDWGAGEGAIYFGSKDVGISDAVLTLQNYKEWLPMAKSQMKKEISISTTPVAEYKGVQIERSVGYNQEIYIATINGLEHVAGSLDAIKEIIDGREQYIERVIGTPEGTARKSQKPMKKKLNEGRYNTMPWYEETDTGMFYAGTFNELSANSLNELKAKIDDFVKEQGGTYSESKSQVNKMKADKPSAKTTAKAEETAKMKKNWLSEIRLQDIESGIKFNATEEGFKRFWDEAGGDPEDAKEEYASFIRNLREDLDAGRVKNYYEWQGFKVLSNGMDDDMDKSPIKKVKDVRAGLVKSDKATKTVKDIIALHKNRTAIVFYSDAKGNIKKDAKALSLSNPKVHELTVGSIQLRKVKNKECVIIGAVQKRGRPIRSDGKGKITKADGTYLVDGKTFYDAYEIAEYIIDNNDGDYDDWLDEISGDVVIGSLKYSASRVLREVDPIAYRVGMDEFVDAEGNDLEYQLDEMSPGDKIEWRGYMIDVISNDMDKSKKGGMKVKPVEKSYADKEIEALEKAVYALDKEDTVRVSEVSNNSTGFSVRMGVGKINPFSPDHRRTEMTQGGTTSITPINLKETNVRLGKKGEPLKKK